MPFLSVIIQKVLVLLLPEGIMLRRLHRKVLHLGPLLRQKKTVVSLLGILLRQRMGQQMASALVDRRALPSLME